ncbi:MAG: iron-siderophore ABC transporter substrate-binding protein, partial [Ilumatobacteraceae bacterium]
MRIRPLLALCGVAVLASIAVACGDDDSTTSPSAPSTAGDTTTRSTGDIATDATTAGSGVTYPLTVTHAYGTSTFPARPERVVTLGYGDEDPVAALGVTPVGALDYDSGSLSPWLTEALGD